MADSIVGALRVLLGLDTAAFSSGIKDATGQLNSFGNQFSTLAKRLGIAAAATAFVYDIKRMIDSADELGKASQKFGIPVETLSALKYAANLADVSFESLSKGLGKLSKAMLSGAVDPTGEAAKNFKALGISVTDAGGNIRSTEAVFGDVAEKFSKMDDGATKTAMAIRIFGKSGADLIPLLNEGRTGIAGMTEEARKLGIVISTETAGRAQQFNDTLKKIHATHDALALRIAEALLPALNKIATMFVGAAKEGGFLTTIINNLITEQDLQEIQRYAQYWENFLRVFGAAKDIMRAVVGTADEWRDALRRGDEAIETNKQKLAELEATFKYTLGKLPQYIDDILFAYKKFGKATDDANTSVLGQKSALDSFIESQGKSITRHEAEAATLNMVLGIRERTKLLMEADTIARENNTKITAAQAAALELLGQRAEAAAIRMAGAKMQDENINAWDLYVKKVDEANKVMEKHPEYADAAKAASLKAAATMIEAYGNVLATAAGQFSEFFKAFGKGNKEMFLISKAFAISQAIINTFVAATNALAKTPLPPPFPQIAAAAAIAFGMAQVAKIVAEKPPAMALGGAFQVGGAGGVDSRMVPIMATPGERVHVEQNKYGDSAGGRTVTIAGIKPKDYYTGDVLRDFVDNLNQAIGDGLKIKMA